MCTLLILIVVLGIIFWAIAELVSSLAAIFFVSIAALIVLKLAKDLLGK